MRFKQLLFISALLYSSLSAYGDMTLNEVMFDPDGNDNTDEFVELYNDAAIHKNLEGWRISDGEGTDSLVALDQGLIAAPHQYVLILDPDYFTSGSTTYDGRVPESALVVTISGSTFGSRGFSNSEAETLTVYDAGGEIISCYTYSIGNATGRSDEKMLSSGGDSSSNWADAIVHHGTPGYRNSVTPPDRDLAVSSFSASPETPQPGEAVTLTIVVSNVGLSALTDSLVLSERTGDGDPWTLLQAWAVSALLSGDSIAFVSANLTGTAAPRFFRAELLGVDDQIENNIRELTLSPSGTAGGVIINEIMYSPETGMSEWVELLNTGFSSASLSGWTFGDGTGISDTSRRLTLASLSLAVDSMVILAADSSIFFEYLPLSAQVIVWNTSNISLNNNGDSLVLWDQSGTMIDRVDYRPSWGGEMGLSLERISASALSNDPLNWATSLDSTGGTPGRMNSRAFPESEFSENILTLEPNPFSPNGDGRDDLLAIQYNLDQADAQLDLKIYDVRGRKVKQLASNAVAGFQGALLWDGTDEQGRILPTGMYIIYLEALGRGGTRIQSARRVVALARPL